MKDKDLIMKVTLILMICLLYLSTPEFQNLIYQGISSLKQHDFHGLKTLILSYGTLAPIISIILMTTQSVFPFVPGIIMTITNAWLFGWYLGTVYSCIGALLGAILDFMIARWYGQMIVCPWIKKEYADKINDYINRNGVIAIFVTRLIPFVPFKLISYSAGLSNVSLKSFIFVTGIGQIPGIAAYSILGENMQFDKVQLFLITIILFILAGIIYYFREFFNSCILKLNK
ncbi:TVP38/TMEM64 family protein [Anaerosinus massiliensis]|uniref:TVP38/TMEM64 family protein n=1 Tax=Massilibacillus massiliensis TaxID=1806837 RepID=UPI000DA62C32|nr:TVP38/TMEM64 family protein [Massilibacillus massiliensis]